MTPDLCTVCNKPAHYPGALDTCLPVEAKMKAKIVHTGTFDANGMPTGWTFDCAASIPGLAVATNGEILVAGYTFAELTELNAAFLRRYAPKPEDAAEVSSDDVSQWPKR
jgi:hypothetical protein